MDDVDEILFSQEFVNEMPRIITKFVQRAEDKDNMRADPD